jgi:hypothetical protein
MNSTHVGRGGAANVFKPSAEEIEVAKRANRELEVAVLEEKEWGVKGEKGLADRGKEWLVGFVGDAIGGVGGKKN